MSATCGALTKGGTPCRNALNLSPANGLCIQHDPTRKREVMSMRKAGARAMTIARRKRMAAIDPKQIPKRPTTIEEAKRFLAWIGHAVVAGTIAPSVAREATAAVREFLSTIDLSEKEEKLRREIARVRALSKKVRRG